MLIRSGKNPHRCPDFVLLVQPTVLKAPYGGRVIGMMLVLGPRRGNQAPESGLHWGVVASPRARGNAPMFVASRRPNPHNMRYRSGRMRGIPMVSPEAKGEIE